MTAQRETLLEKGGYHRPGIIERAPVLAPGHTAASVTDKISGVILSGTPRWFYPAFGISFAFVMILTFALAKLFWEGVGIWGVMQPVGWGFAIINFVWWIGIGHAGTLISAILLLLRQEWRTSINRFAEAMTIFAVACAGVFPLVHVGRPWLAYWLLPYPNTMGLWPQFRSPLVWDVFAVSTYATVSLLFWFMGLIPDLATLRDRSTNRIGKVLYGMAAMGWRNSAKHWHEHEVMSLLLAGLATPLVLSVHSVVSFDFAVGIVPGWHTTIFPPYFVAGAIYAGFAMVLTCTIPLRKIFGLQDFITQRHLENMGKVMLATGLIVGYGYLMEGFTAWYSADRYETFFMWNRIFGPYHIYWYTLITCNIIAPQSLWVRRVRTSPVGLWIVCMFVNLGMWLERFIIVVTSLHRDFLPSSWGIYHGTIWDFAVFFGTVGLFLSLLFLFIRFMPMISIFEMRTLAEAKAVSGGDEGQAQIAARTGTMEPAQ